MASPAVGKQPTPNTPKTPSKITGNKGQNTPSKLGQSAASTAKGQASKAGTPAPKGNTPAAKGNAPAATGSKPATPRFSGAKKPVPRPVQPSGANKAKETAQNASQSVQQKAGGATSAAPSTSSADDAKSTVKNGVKNAAQNVQEKADDATSEVQSQAGTNDNDDDEGPMSKVTQAGQQSQEGLEQAAPEPIDDDDDDNDNDDAVGGAQKEAEHATPDTGDVDAGNEADDDDIADDATEKAGQIGESADETTTDDQQEQQQDEPKEQKGSQQQQRGGGLLKGAQGLAGKASGLAGKASKNASKAAQDPAGAAKDTASDVKEGAEDAGEDAQATAEEGLDEAQKVAGDAADEAGDAADEAGDAAEGAQEQAEGAQDAVKEQAEGAQGTADEQAEGAQDEAEEHAEGAQDAAEGVQGEAEEAAEGAQDQAEDAAEGAQDDTEEQAEGTQDAAEDQVEGAQDQAEGAQDQTEAATGIGGFPTDLPEAPEGLLDLSVLKGLEVQSDGTVQNSEGQAIGRLAEGDAEDLEGYPIGDGGEILDEDGDLVGRVELLPDEIKRQIGQAKEEGAELPEGADEYLSQIEGLGEGEGKEEGEGEEGEGEGEEDDDAGPQLPGLDIMNGLTCGVDGLVYDSEGNTIGQVTDGDPEQLQNATLNESGEFIDEEGNVIGHAEIHPEAADLVEQGVYQAAGAGEEAADEAGEQVEGAADDVEGAAEDAEGAAEEGAEGAEQQAEGIEDELPGIEALEGKELNESGEVLDEGGNVLAAITDDDLKQKIEDGEIDPSTLQINDAGEVVDEEGNVLQQLELEPGAAERLGGHPVLDMRILEGRKVNKKGKVLDEDGEEIGELREGEISECLGKKINERGEVLDKKGKLLGRVNVVPGEAAENATKALLEELGELEQEGPDLSVLEGYKVNKKGMILNEDGEPIGQLADGELEQCAGKKVNDKGEILDKEENVIGHVTLVGQEEEGEEQAEGEAEGEEQAEGEGEEQAEEEGETGPELPPLSTLEGLTVNKSGKILDADGNIVGELVEGDAKKLWKSGATCDEEGQFWDGKGHVIGRAQTLPREDAEEEAPFAGLEGLHVVADGYVQDENGNTVGYVTEGDAKKLVGRVVDEDGDILDKKGSAVGHAERLQEEEEQPQEEAADLSFLAGKTVNKAGLVIGDDGVPVARLVEGKPKDLAGMELDEQGQIWNNKGHVIGRVELIPEEEREAKPEGPFAGLEGLRVIEGGKIADEDGNEVGEIVEGNAKRLIGLAVDEDGDIVDRYGNVKGHAEPLPEEEEEQPIDNSILSGKTLNKQGYVVDENGTPFGRLVEGDAKELAGRRCDENGIIYGDTGKQIGRCETLPEGERVARPEGPFAGLEGLRVVQEGWIEDENGNRVGQLVEGNAKRLVGMAVDEDGDIIDKYGNVKGHAEPYEEADEEEVDRSALAGCRVNKNGNAVDFGGQIIGRVVEGDVKNLIGKKVDGQGQVWDDSGNVIGRCDLVYGEDTSPEGPFAGFDSLTINKDGTISTAAGDVIGRVVEGDIKKLMGHSVDEDGDITDKNGNVIGKAERWEPEEKERRANPMSGKRVNKEGEVRDENGDLMGRLTSGDLGHCVGQEIDDSGNVVDVDGNKIGEVTLIENIAEDYEGPSEEELEEARKREEESEIAKKMSAICQDTVERMQPICKQITEHMEKADRTPKEELDEEELVNQVKPLIEEGGRILQECNGSLRGLDPDGHIAAQAKGRSGTGEATPEEHRLAETLKELTTTVVTTIDNAKKKLNDMPHAKKKLNPLWGLLTQPLFQILAAVGLLLAGVLGLVGQLLNGLGLGGLVNGLMGGLGINKLMESFGLGGGDKKKGKSGGGSKLSSLPVVGGLLGGGK